MMRLLSGLLLLSLSISCNQAKFGGDAKKEKNSREANPETLILEVTTPSDTIKAGGNTMQATALLKGKSEIPEVIWSLEADLAERGSIDEKGLYTSPESTESEFPLTLVASLKKDPRVKGKKTIRVIPHKVIFVECMEGSENFPIEAKVYQMNPNVKKLPDYSNPSEAVYKTKVCMENYAVEPRDFGEGFPKVSELFEYFSLQTTATLVVPEDGVYTFQLNSDDGSRLFLDNTEVINNDGEHQAFGPDPRESQKVGLKEAVITLSKGEHKLSLNYFQGPRYRIGLMLKWKTPGSDKFVYVPKEAFK